MRKVAKMTERSEEKQEKMRQAAIDKMMSARRAIVDVRLDRATEDELLQKTSEILDVLEGVGSEGNADDG